MEFKKILSVVISFAMILGCAGFTAMAENPAFGGGNGTAETPYIIATADDFISIASYNGGDNSGVYYKQTADISLSGYTPFTFNGNYDGDGNNINLALSSGHYMAMFKELSGNASVANITFSGSAYGWSGAASVAYDVLADSNVTISNIVNNATVRSDNHAAGIVCYSNVGGGGSLSIVNCRNNGSVSGSKNVSKQLGGILAKGKAVIEKCMNTGTITGATISGNDGAGGILGVNQTSATKIINCLNTGDILATGNVGGIMGAAGVGGSGPSIITSYTTTGVVLGAVVGGGKLYGTNNFYLSDSETDDLENTTALTKDQMEDADMTYFTGFSSDVWEMKKDTGYFYPQLKNNYIYVEWGTEENPYIIDSAEDFIAIGTLSSTEGKYFKQTKSFELTAHTPFDFAGYYDGCGNTITADFKGGSYIALFKALYGNAKVSDITIEGKIYGWTGAASIAYDVIANSNVTVSGIVNNASVRSDNHAAGIICYSNVGGGGTLNITNCRNNGSVSGNPNVSKLLGGILAKGKAVIEKCINTGTISGATISGNDGAGGILGVNQTSATKIINCLNTGEIIATGNVGGLMGTAGISASGPAIQTSYTTSGKVLGAIVGGGRLEGSNIFYLSDSETDDLANTTALTKAQMEDAAMTYFTGFSTDVWEMKKDTGYFYPQLKNNYIYVEWGTEENPYIIDSAEAFKAIANLETTEGKYFRQTESFTLDTHTPFDFSGIYDGGNNTITLSLKESHYFALFNKLSGNASVSDIVVEGSIKAWTSGAAIALSVAAGANVTVSGIVNNADISSTNNVAGIILDATSVGSGTLIITECINNGTILSEATGNPKYNGGILGFGKAVITKCYNTGTIISAAETTGIYGAGGIAGGLRTSLAKIENCFNTGEIKAKGNAGGILGVAGMNSSNSTVKTSYTITSVPVGGIAPGGSLAVSDVFYLSDSETDTLDGTIALGESDMKDLAKFNGFSTDVWTTDATTGYDYPQLKGMFITFEAGSIDNPYPVSDEATFVAMKDNLSKDVYYELTKDIVLSENYVPYAFVDGNLLGNGHTITLNMTRTEDYAGLFTYISGASYIDNIVIDGSVSGTNCVGALCGEIKECGKTTISNIKNNADVTGSGSRVGGVIGNILNAFSMKNIVNNGNVTGGEYWTGGIAGVVSFGIILDGLVNNGDVIGANSGGGIAGCTYGHVKNSYNTGSISAPNAGGIIGYTMNGGDIDGCFNMGKVTKILTPDVNNFISVGGILGSAGANGTVVSNCYDAGYLSVSENAIIGKIDAEKEITAEIINCYYLNPVKAFGKNGTTPVTPEELKALSISDTFETIEGLYPQIKGITPVSSVPELVAVTVECGKNGLVDSETRYAAKGENLEIQVLPAIGYQTGAILVDGNPVSCTDNVIVIEVADKDISVSVSFDKLILTSAEIIKTFDGSELVDSDYVIYGLGTKYKNKYSTLLIVEVSGEYVEAGVNLYSGDELIGKVPASTIKDGKAGIFLFSENMGLYTAKPYVIDADGNETEGDSASFILSVKD